MADIQIGVGHTPSSEQQRKHTARSAMRGYDAALEDLTTNWSGFSAAQQREALRAMLIILARSVHWLMTQG
jgi:hypothetical protein